MLYFAGRDASARTFDHVFAQAAPPRPAGRANARPCTGGRWTPGADLSPRLIVSASGAVAGHSFPLLAGDAEDRA